MMTPSPAQALAMRAYERAIAGDLTDAARVLSKLASSNDLASRISVALLGVQIWLAAPTAVKLPELAVIEAAREAPVDVRRAALLCAQDLSLARSITFDCGTLAALEDIAGALACGLEPSAEAHVNLIRAYGTLSRGDAEGSSHFAAAAAEQASAGRLAFVLVQATAVRALAALSDSDSSGALALARRASLMGRSEGIPHAEFLAHVVLARARRFAGQPHLTLRVLEVLRAVVSRPWRGWLAWEWLWAGGAPDAVRADLAALPESAATLATAAFASALAAAPAGDAALFRASIDMLIGDSARPAFVLRESEEFAGAVAVHQARTSAALRAWCAGDSVLTPPSLSGLRLRSRGDSEETAAAYVLLIPGETALRILHWGVPLLRSESFRRIKQSQRTQGRVETLLSVLALASADGLPAERCFAETYGFPYVAEVHRGVFEVLLHRARSVLEAVDADIARRDARLFLDAQRALLIPDPRISQRTTDRVLRLLAERGMASARNAAGSLGVSLRAAQSALKELASSGACQTRRDGRFVVYVVEDTVFSEPTSRFSEEQLAGLSGARSL